MMDNSSGQPEFLDQIAVTLSGLCLAHCLLLPLAVVTLPFLGGLGDDHLHAELLLVVIPVSVAALWFGYRRHRNLGIVGAGLTGLAILLIGATVAHVQYGLLADRILTVAGSLLLAFTHFRNFRQARCRVGSAIE
jgi:MFS superfamily sulfate permease-like transporter